MKKIQIFTNRVYRAIKIDVDLYEEVENDKVEKKSEVIEPTNKAEDEETNTKEELVEQEESTEAKLEGDKNE